MDDIKRHTDALLEHCKNRAKLWIEKRAESKVTDLENEDDLAYRQYQEALKWMEVGYDFLAWLKTEYKATKRPFKYRKWLLEDEKIMKAIGKTRFLDVYDFIFKNCFSLSAIMQHTKVFNLDEYDTKRKDDEGRPIMHPHVLFKPKYTRMTAELKMPKKPFKCILLSFVKLVC